MQIIHSVGIDAPVYNLRCRLLTCALITSQMGPLLFNMDDAGSIISKSDFRLRQFSASPQFILNELKLRELSSISGSCLFNFFLCMVEF